MDTGFDSPRPLEVSESDVEQQPLYRGVWVNKIKDGDKIPVGGSIFGDEPDIMLTIDTEWMRQVLEGVTAEKIDQAYLNGNKDIFEKWVKDYNLNIDLDPQLLHKLYQVQLIMRKILSVGEDNVANERSRIYFDNKDPKLSDFIGKSECAEQAIVGKMLLDKLGINTVMMEGVHVDGIDDYPSDHTFLIMDDVGRDGSLIFDIARPKASVGGFPRVLRTNAKLDYTVFKGKNNLVVPAIDVYNKTTLYYGVGNSSLLQDVNFSE